MSRKELPLIACSLDAGGQEQRAREWRELAARASAVERAGGGVTLRFARDLEQTVRDLVAAESECCPFFDFGLDVGLGARDDVTLSIGAPAEAQPLIEALLIGTSPA